MASDDDDDLNLDAVVGPPLGDAIPAAVSAGTLPLASSIHEPIPPLRDEIRARLVKVGEDGTTESGGDAENSSVLLEDPEGYATQTAVLSTWAYMLALLFDGRRTAVQASKMFFEKYNHSIQPEQVISLQNELEQAMFLNSSSFEDQLHQRMNRYLSMPVWTAAHAGSAYPADPGALTATFQGFFTAPDGPGGLPAPALAPVDTLRALVVPHIDLRVGGATYAHAYKALLETSQAEIIFVLGVAHQYTGDHLFSVSQKNFETPLGVLPNAHDISSRLHTASRTDDVAAEMAHRGEFSIEFQAALIQTLLVQRGKRNIQIVPILCGSVDAFLGRDENPLQDENFNRFAHALRAELQNCSKKWCVMCSVDLSHVGPEFEHSTMIDERMLKPIARMDQRLIRIIEKLDPTVFYREIARSQNSRRVDAVLSVLTMLHACRGLLKSGKLLHYDQMLKANSHSAVSYAAMVFE